MVARREAGPTPWILLPPHTLSGPGACCESKSGHAAPNRGPLGPGLSREVPLRAFPPAEAPRTRERDPGPGPTPPPPTLSQSAPVSRAQGRDGRGGRESPRLSSGNRRLFM